jgi:hypothetical protein
MSDFHFIAVLTYGTEKQRDVSSFKIGHGAGADVLLALFGSRATETTPPRAGYRYIHLDGHAATHRNYLVLRVTPEEKVQVEAICRKQGSFPWVYLWQDNCWLEFPCAPQAHYIDPSSYGGSQPKFPPGAAKFIMPSQPAASDDEDASSDANVGVTLTQSGDWWWIAGETYPHRESLRAAGAKWSKTRREWYYKGRALPQAIRDLAEANQQVPIDPISTTLVPMPTAPIPAPIVVEVKPDNVQSALERLKATPKIVAATNRAESKRGTASIAQEYVGELTGSITGNVHCFGYAVDRGVCVYLNFGGPRTAVEAIRAKFSKGEIVSCVPWDSAAVELTPGEGNTGKYRDFMQNIPEARYTSVILLHEQITEPNYGGKSRTCIVRTDEAQGVAMLKHHVTQLVNVPVFDGWTDYLWTAGELACLVTRPIRAGGIDLWAVDLDADAWTRLICGGLEKGLITLPMNESHQPVDLPTPIAHP